MDNSGQLASRKRMRLLSIAVPLIGLLLLYPLRLLLLQWWSTAAVDSLVGLLASAGILTFSWWIFRYIERQDQELIGHYDELERRFETERRLRDQLEVLHQAALTLAAAHTPDQMLQRLVDLSRELIGAQYGALSVTGVDGSVETLYTAGMSEEERRQLGPLPQGHGILGLLLKEETVIRVSDLASDPRCAGVPSQHPSMRNLVGVSMVHAGHVLGMLYLANKLDGEEFTAEDEHLLTMLSGHSAVVVEFARLTEQVRVLAVEAERERIRKDLHDGVIQAIYSVNLELEGAAEDIAQAPEATEERINQAIDRLNEVIKDIRSYILGLQTVSDETQSLPQALSALLAETQAHTMLETELSVEGAAAPALPPPLVRELLQMAREAITNVVRHAHAGRMWATLQTQADEVHLRIADNGAGFAPDTVPSPDQQGLRNLAKRAHELGGALTIQSAPGKGTAIDVRIPLLQLAERERTDV